jgi:hypothetical protein
MRLPPVSIRIGILHSIFLVVLFTNFAFSQSNSDHVSHLYKVELSTGQVIADTFAGTRLQGASSIAARGAEGWSLVGVGNFGPKNGMVHSDAATGALAVLFYGRSNDAGMTGSALLDSPGKDWSPTALADFNGDGNLDVVFVNKTTGQADVHFYGGAQGTAALGHKTISLLSTTGWNVVGAADLNQDGHPDLILQNPQTGQVLADHLGGSDGVTVTATQDLGTFKGLTASGMLDMNGDGRPDLILVNPATGQTIVSYYGGATGSTPLGTANLEGSTPADWALVVPSASTSMTGGTLASTNTTTNTALSAASLSPTPAPTTSSVPILLFNGTGTSSSDVTAVENVITNAGYSYNTANSSQLDGMTQAQLAVYKLFVVPGGNSITIGRNLTSKATNNVRNAVAQDGLHYLGFCAGAFFGGYSMYNGVDLTSGVWFSKYADSKSKDALWISFPAQAHLDIYWQGGPDLSQWGYVVGKYPNGHPAIVEGHWGNGFVLLSGVHPEAPASWRYGMTFGTSVDVDLAYARTLVKAAFTGTMLPHF